MKGTPVRMVGRPMHARAGAVPSSFGPFDIPTLMQMMQELSTMHTQVLEGVKAVQETASKINDIKQGPPGMPGKPGASVNHEAVVRDVLTSMPKPKNGTSPTVDSLVGALLPLVTKKVKSKLPPVTPHQTTADLPAVVPQAIDYEAIANALFDLLEKGKRKIKLEHVAGLEGKIAEVRNHVALQGKQYGKDTWARGGGGSGSTGLTVITTSGTVDDSNLVFAFASQPTLLCINGAFYRTTGGAYTWSYSGGNATISSPVGTGGTIYGVK